MKDEARHLKAPARPGRFGTLRTALELVAVVLLALWFHAPLLEEGIPPGDFGSDVMVGEVQDRLVPWPWSGANWNPWLACGKPTLTYWSPTNLLELPLRGLDPVRRLEALVLLFHAAAGAGMYGLVRWCGAGRLAALFGGVAYPLAPAHVTRVAVFGHVHAVMLFALLPAFFWALFRLRRRDLPGTVVLALVLAACLYRDIQRSLMVVAMVGVVLAGEALARGLVLAWRTHVGPEPPGAWHRAGVAWITCRPVLLGTSLALALGAAVAVNAADIFPRFTADPYAGGWLPGEKAAWMNRWSLRNVYTFLDWRSLLGDRLEAAGLDFYGSVSRYLGLSVLALAAAGALLPERLGELRRRFWLVLLLLPVSAWLSFGVHPAAPHVLDRWSELASAESVGWPLKLGLGLLGLGALALAVRVVELNVPFPRWRIACAASVVLGAIVAMLYVPLLPGLRTVAFFLRPVRNPDWFQVAVSSFAACFAGALGVAALQRAWGRRPWWPALGVAILALPVADFWPYRAEIDVQRRLRDDLRGLRAAAATIAADPEDVRVAPGSVYDNLVDLAGIWHGKRLAWEFRTYSAPRGTHELMMHAYQVAGGEPKTGLLADMLGVANAKYVLAVGPDAERLTEAEGLHLVERHGRIRLLVNTRVLPFARVVPTVHVVDGATERAALLRAVELARAGSAGVRSEHPPPAALEARCATLQADPWDPRNGRASWSRPSPGEITVEVTAPGDAFLVVSESFHPWWTATLDGDPVDLHAADHAFLGVFVPAGEHAVHLTFRWPPHHLLAIPVSVVSLLALVAALVVLRRRDRWRATGPPLL